MKKTNLMKVVSILLISVMVILFNANVFAADNTGFNDLTSTLTNTSNSSNSGASNTNSSSNNISFNTSSNSNSNSSFSSNSNTSSNSNRVNTSSNSNNSSIYNTNLPKTGVESSMPFAMLIIILGVSAVYAYRKIKEYKNI